MCAYAMRGRFWSKRFFETSPFKEVERPDDKKVDQREGTERVTYLGEEKLQIVGSSVTRVHKQGD